MPMTRAPHPLRLALLHLPALLGLAALGCDGSSTPGAAEQARAAAATGCLVSPGAPVAASRQFSLDQTDVFAVDTSGRPSVTWVEGAGAWHDLAPMVPSSVARSGARLAASSRFGTADQTDVYFVDALGAVNVTWVVGTGAWHAPQRLTATGVAPSGAALAASNQFGLAGQTDVFFVDRAGAVNVLWSSGGRWYGPARITATGVAPPGGAVAASNQFGLANQTDVFFVDRAGAVNVLWVVGAGRWNGPVRISPTWSAPPGAALAASAHHGIAGRTDLFFVDRAGAVSSLWVVGAGRWNGPARLTPTGVAPPGGAVAASNQFGLSDQTDVFFVDTAGAVNVAWIVGAGPWYGPARITATGTAPPGGALAASAQFGIPGQTDVHFVDSGCAVNVLWVNYAGDWGWGRNGLGHQPSRAEGLERFYADGALLAVYDRGSNTFTWFQRGGVNLIGGFSSGDPGTNYGPSARGHSPDYPFGRLDAPPAETKGRWEGFWAGYNFINSENGAWEGVNGNPGAERLFEVQMEKDGVFDLHVVTSVDGPHGPDFTCDVHYLLSREGIGVSNHVTFLRQIFPTGWDDGGGQLLMTQADIDLDPDAPDPVYPYSHSRALQPSLYWKLALDGFVQPIDSFPPYSQWTPSNVYSENEAPSPPGDPAFASHGLPDRARVPAGLTSTYLTPFDRPDRDQSLALRIDLARSTLPPLEYYCEVNGERDYFNYLYSSSVGNNVGTSVPAGTEWQLYGELRPWRGADPTVLQGLPFLSDLAP